MYKEELKKEVEFLKNKIKIFEYLKECHDRVNFCFREVIEKTPVGICIVDEKGFFDYVNPAYCDMFQYKKEELLGKHFSTISSEKKMLKIFGNVNETRSECKFMKKDGSSINIIADTSIIIDRQKNYKKVDFIIDITDKILLENKLKDSKKFLEDEIKKRTRTLVNTIKELNESQKLAKIASWMWDIKKNKVKWSKELYQILGLRPESFDGKYKTFLKMLHPDDRQVLEEKVKNALESSESYEIEYRIALPDKPVKYMFGKGQLIRDQNGNPFKLFGIAQDITERKQNEKQITMLSTAIEESINMIVLADFKGRIEYVNAMFEKVTGYTKEEIMGQTPRVLASGETPEYVYEEIWSKIKQGKAWRGEFKNKKKNGDFYWVNGTISPVKTNDGKELKILSVQEDITEKKISEQKAVYLSTHDAKTGLFNRENFISQLNDKITEKEAFCLILFDIDGLKYINDTYGHSMGDEVLKGIVKIITNHYQNIFKTRNLIGRFGDDEIIVCISNINSKKAIEFSNHIRKHVEEFKLTRDKLSAGISAGIVSFPDQALLLNEVLSRLEAALLRAKNTGKNKTHMYEESDKNLVNYHFKRKKEERIIKALNEDRLEIWFQPILDLNDDTIHHFEVLVRMREEDGSIGLPGTFIPLAEETGLINQIDRVVIEKAIKAQAEFEKQGKNISLSMNLSAKDLDNDSLKDFIKTTITQSKTKPANLVFELTETAAINDFPTANEFIMSLQSIGCKISLDDFGVGFTSFVYLKEMKVDFIKIDGVFIKSIFEDKKDQDIVKAISYVAKGSNIKTIAEFVENKKIVNMLKSMGVDYAQGFYIGKPDPCPKFQF